MQLHLDFITNVSWDGLCWRETMLPWNFPLEGVWLFPCKSGRWKTSSQEVKSQNKTEENKKKEKKKSPLWFYASCSSPHLGIETCCWPWLGMGSEGWKDKLAAGKTPVPNLLLKSYLVLRRGREDGRFPEGGGAIAPQRMICLTSDLITPWKMLLFREWVSCFGDELPAGLHHCLEYSSGEAEKRPSLSSFHLRRACIQQRLGFWRLHKSCGIDSWD